MIHLGLPNSDKQDCINRYIEEYNIDTVFVFSPTKFKTDYVLNAKVEFIEYNEIIQYKFYYPLLQKINPHSLIVIDECLRTQNRYDLTYNCLRNFLNQTKHQLVFQYLPIIEDIEDFMILFDFDSQSRYKRESFSTSLLSTCSININELSIQFEWQQVVASKKTKLNYQKQKEKLFSSIGLKDPHTIPRNLYLVGGGDKLAKVEEDKFYIGRNNRFKLDNLETYKSDSYPNSSYTIFELSHNFIDVVDFLSLSKQTNIPILIADLKVDVWYKERYSQWLTNLQDAYTKIR